MPRQKEVELNGVAALYHARQLAERGISPSDAEFEQLYPTLFSILTNNRIEADKVIDPPSLMLRNSSGDWCLGISIPSLGFYGELMFKTHAEALPGVELALASGRFPWKINLKKGVKTRSLKTQEK